MGNLPVCVSPMASCTWKRVIGQQGLVSIHLIRRRVRSARTINSEPHAEYPRILLQISQRTLWSVSCGGSPGFETNSTWLSPTLAYACSRSCTGYMLAALGFIHTCHVPQVLVFLSRVDAPSDLQLNDPSLILLSSSHLIYHFSGLTVEHFSHPDQGCH